MLMSYITYAFNELDVCMSSFHVSFLLVIWQVQSFTVRLNQSKNRAFG